MSDRPHSESAKPVLAGRSAFRLGAVLIVGFAGMTTFAAVERMHRTQLESHEETTAVGDTRYAPAPDPLEKPSEPVATFKGQPLYPVTWKRIEIRDPRMTRIGEDDQHHFNIYSTSETISGPESESNRQEAGGYYLKTGTNEYIKVRPESAGR